MTVSHGYGPPCAPLNPAAPSCPCWAMLPPPRAAIHRPVFTADACHSNKPFFDVTVEDFDLCYKINVQV